MSVTNMVKSEALLTNIITSKVSAALFKSRTPSSACLIRLMNFLVKRPEREKYMIMSSSSDKQNELGLEEF